MRKEIADVLPPSHSNQTRQRRGPRSPTSDHSGWVAMDGPVRFSWTIRCCQGHSKALRSSTRRIDARSVRSPHRSFSWMHTHIIHQYLSKLTRTLSRRYYANDEHIECVRLAELVSTNSTLFEAYRGNQDRLTTLLGRLRASALKVLENQSLDAFGCPRMN